MMRLSDQRLDAPQSVGVTEVARLSTRVTFNFANEILASAFTRKYSTASHGAAEHHRLSLGKTLSLGNCLTVKELLQDHLGHCSSFAQKKSYEQWFPLI